jgi:proprotein convertase subtilisin/kexin type 2
MTTHTWGENPRGRWRLVVRFQSGKSTPIEQQKYHNGWLKKFTLMLHGTKEPPYVGIEVILNYKFNVAQSFIEWSIV